LAGSGGRADFTLFFSVAFLSTRILFVVEDSRLSLRLLMFKRASEDESESEYSTRAMAKRSSSLYAGYDFGHSLARTVRKQWSLIF
jgi:hypothetical protein